MLKFGIMEAKGFEVIHNSQGWRIAEHAFEENVNGISSFVNWGRHMDSEEAFLLLCGKGWLVTSADGNDYEIHPLKDGEMQLVQVAERHAILLEEGARALIVENQDMSNSVTEPMGAELAEKILSEIKKMG